MSSTDPHYADIVLDSPMTPAKQIGLHQAADAPMTPTYVAADCPSSVPDLLPSGGEQSQLVCASVVCLSLTFHRIHLPASVAMIPHLRSLRYLMRRQGRANLSFRTHPMMSPKLLPPQ